MCNLLRANLLRLRKNVLFWGTLLLSFGCGICITAVQVREQIKYGGFPDSAAFFRYAALIGLVIAVFVSLFFGTEYSDGAIRNKITVGLPRTSIYLANLITGAVSSLLFYLAYFAASFGLSLLFIRSGVLQVFEFPPLVFALTFVGILALSLAYTGLFLLVTMNCSHKASSAVVCILSVFLMLIFGNYLGNRLGAPEYASGYFLDADGQIVLEEPEPNPRYLRGMEREVYQFLYDFTPGGQSSQYSSASAENPEILPVYSLIIFLASTAGGIALFRKKDLK